MARSRGGGRQPIRLLVGHYPTISLAEARDRGRPLLRDLQDGIDPRARKAEQLRAEAAERERRFDALAEQFIQRLAAARTARAIALRIRRELIARWGDRSIDKISQVDIAGMVTEIAERGHREAARQTFTYARRLFRWAAARGVFLKHAPTDYLNIKDLIGAKKARQRLLRDEELVLIWRAAAQAQSPTVPTSSYCCCSVCAGPNLARPSGARSISVARCR